MREPLIPSRCVPASCCCLVSYHHHIDWGLLQPEPKLMSSNYDSKRGICILSLDGGGPGTYSQLLILKEYMSRLASDSGVSEEEIYPADYFDLIGGVGFGGLAAVMLGLLRMSVSQAIEELVTIASSVFRNGSQQVVDQSENSHRVKQVVEGMILAESLPLDAKMYEPSRPISSCKVALCAATSTNLNQVHIFRSYSHRGSSLNPTIVEAICATMAIPSHFSPVKIGPRLRQQIFVGGAIGANNPTRELLKEAGSVFGKESRVAQIISIGSGIPPVLSLDSEANDANLNRLLKDITTDCEGVAQELHTRLYNIQAYLRLNVERGLSDIGMEDWGGLGAIESHTGAYIVVASVSESIDTSLRRLRERFGTVTLGQVNQSSSIKLTVKMAPAVSPHFVPRTGPWTRMVYHLVSSDSSRQKIFPITGMGGCGKTQMVSYFLQEHPSQYTHMAFVDASSLYSVQSDLQAWAQAFGDGHERDVWEDAIRFFNQIPLNERWLLVLDNADDPTLNLVPFIPRNPNLTIIITSRNRDLRNLSTIYHLELGEMEPDEALATLLRAAQRELPLSNEEMKDAQTLIKELGCLAVALVQAGTYCYQLSSHHRDIPHPYTFTRYLSLFYTHRAELMQKAQPSPLDNYERGVYTTLDLSYQAVPPRSRAFLHFLSFFHHTNIPLAALAAAAKNGFADGWSLLPRPEDHERLLSDLADLLGAEKAWDEFQVQEAIGQLRSFSLIEVTSTSDDLFLQMHPLTQAWSRDKVSSTSQNYRGMVIQVMTSCAGGGLSLLHRCILPHTLDVLGQVDIHAIHVNDLMGLGEVLKTQGYYRKATGLVNATLEIMTNCGEKSAEKRLLVAARLATLYWEDGRWEGAEKLEIDVLEQQKRVLGMEHPDTILAAANLASTYHSQGRWSEAEKLRSEVLEQWRRVLGMEHPDTIRAAANLAATYHTQGRWNEAEKLRSEVLERWKRVLGKEHPDTIRAAGNLAVTYWKQGRLTEAEELEVGVLEQRKRGLGIEHPDTIRAVANLAATYWKQGRLDEAEKLEVEVLEQLKRVLGMEHPDTLRAAVGLASTYNSQGRWSEAEKLGVEVLEQRKRVLGLEHPSTILAAANLAVTYEEQDRLSEAAVLLAPVVELGVKVLGRQHPDTQQDARMLVRLYEQLGKQKEAGDLKALLLS